MTPLQYTMIRDYRAQLNVFRSTATQGQQVKLDMLESVEWEVSLTLAELWDFDLSHRELMDILRATLVTYTNIPVTLTPRHTSQFQYDLRDNYRHLAYLAVAA